MIRQSKRQAKSEHQAKQFQSVDIHGEHQSTC
jgi:hypothetical protein